MAPTNFIIVHEDITGVPRKIPWIPPSPKIQSVNIKN